MMRPVLTSVRTLGRNLAVSYSVQNSSNCENIPVFRPREPRRKQLQEVFAPLPERRKVPVVGELEEVIWFFLFSFQSNLS